MLACLERCKVVFIVRLRRSQVEDQVDFRIGNNLCARGIRLGDTVLRGFALGRERAFLLSAPAREIGVADAEDELLVQGVVDLLAVRGEECVIVDYKYSSHGAERLAADYLPQLRIYAAAARRIPGVRRVSACIVNILRGFSVDVPV